MTASIGTCIWNRQLPHFFNNIKPVTAEYRRVPVPGDQVPVVVKKETPGRLLQYHLKTL